MNNYYKGKNKFLLAKHETHQTSNNTNKNYGRERNNRGTQQSNCRKKQNDK
jgi:hypothetical protein